MAGFSQVNEELCKFYYCHWGMISFDILFKRVKQLFAEKKIYHLIEYKNEHIYYYI